MIEPCALYSLYRELRLRALSEVPGPPAYPQEESGEDGRYQSGEPHEPRPERF